MVQPLPVQRISCDARRMIRTVLDDTALLWRFTVGAASLGFVIAQLVVAVLAPSEVPAMLNAG